MTSKEFQDLTVYRISAEICKAREVLQGCETPMHDLIQLILDKYKVTIKPLDTSPTPPDVSGQQITQTKETQI